MINDFKTNITKNGCTVALYDNKRNTLQKQITTRYKNIPTQWLEFAETVQCMMNAEETVWFLCAVDFEAQQEGAFQWNEWETLSLESAKGDSEWERKIQAFWDNHLPIIQSVKGGYSYYAISMNDGSVVRGAEPEFEECEVVAGSFSDFMEKIVSGKLLFATA